MGNGADGDAAGSAPCRVIVLSGPSGAGKSRLADRLHARHGWPILRLDDFYKELGDPSLPRGEWGIPNWDHVDSWNCERAVAALVELCLQGSIEVPVYDISTSRATGHTTVTAAAGQVVLAEGIFAAHTVEPLRQHGVLAAAWCIRNGPWLTFGRRLVRDLAQRRKPPHVLWQRGHQLRRAEPQIVAAQEALGAEALTAREAEERVGAVLGRGRR